MQAFIKVYFVVFVFGMVVNTLTIAVAEFPKVEERGIGYYIANVLANLPFGLWAAYLIWA